MKDKKIRILCVIAAVLSVAAIIPIMFEFKDYYTTDFWGNQYSYSIYGFQMYSDKEMWWFILIGVLGVISLLWNLVYGAYAIIDGRYGNLTWRIARYGYFFGIVAGIINFGAIMSDCCNSAPAAWAFIAMIAVVVVIETVLIFLKDEDTKSKLQEISEDSTDYEIKF